MSVGSGDMDITKYGGEIDEYNVKMKSEERKRLKLESLADDCKGLRDMTLDMLQGDTHMVDVKKLVKYAWENTEGEGRPISATEEEWSRPPGTAQSLMGGNVATYEGTTTSQVRSWASILAWPVGVRVTG